MRNTPDSKGTKKSQFQSQPGTTRRRGAGNRSPSRFSRMHTRRIATFLLGIWLGCSVLIGWIAMENSRLAFGAGGALLVEQDLLHLYAWEGVQLGLGLVLAMSLPGNAEA